MFERPAGGGRALIVALDFGRDDPDYRLAEIDAKLTGREAPSAEPALKRAAE